MLHRPPVNLRIVDVSLNPPEERNVQIPALLIEEVWQLQFHNPEASLSRQAQELYLMHGETLYELATQQMQEARDSTLH